MCDGRLSNPACLRAFELEAELGRDHHLIANGRERFADELLVGERTVRLGGVEERDAAVDGRSNDRDAVLAVAAGP